MNQVEGVWYASFNPIEDITLYELSRCLALFGDLSKSIKIPKAAYKIVTENPEPYVRHIQFRNYWAS